jgi:transcriptional regulator with XRE-family HTH domain
MFDHARGWQLAELRERRQMTQDQVAVARIAQIERGDVSTQDVFARYVAALGGTSNSSPKVRGFESMTAHNRSRL